MAGSAGLLEVRVEDEAVDVDDDDEGEGASRSCASGPPDGVAVLAARTALGSVSTRTQWKASGRALGSSSSALRGEIRDGLTRGARQDRSGRRGVNSGSVVKWALDTNYRCVRGPPVGCNSDLGRNPGASRDTARQNSVPTCCSAWREGKRHGQRWGCCQLGAAGLEVDKDRSFERAEVPTIILVDYVADRATTSRAPPPGCRTDQPAPPRAWCAREPPRHSRPRAPLTERPPPTPTTDS